MLKNKRVSSSSVYLSAPKLKSPKRFKPEGIGASDSTETKQPKMVWHSGEIRRSLQFHQSKNNIARKMLRIRSHDLFDNLVVSYKYLFLKHYIEP